MQKHENPNIRDVCVDVDTFMIIGRMVLLNCCGAAAAGVYIDSGAGAGRSRAPGTSRTLTAWCISEYQRHSTDTQGAVCSQQTALQCMFQQVTIAIAECNCIH